MRPLFFISLLFIPCISDAQDIKSLELQQQYAKHRVQSRECFRITFNGLTPVDTILAGVEEYDRNGRIIRFQEYNRRGKQVAEYHYGYSQDGRLISTTLSHQYNNWQQIELQLNFDPQGRLLSREVTDAIPGLYKRETFHYSKTGKLVLSEQWYDIKGTMTPLIRNQYPEAIEKHENSLSFIYDEHELLVVEQLFINGRSDEMINYNYTFRH